MADETPLFVDPTETPLARNVVETPLARNVVETPLALDRLSAARSVGYSWPEIDDHIASGTSAAAAAGYTQPEIDNHLGYSDPKPAADDARATWTSALSQPDRPLADENGFLTGVDLNSPSLAADYSRALLNGHVKSPAAFADHYAAGFLNAAHDLGDYSPEETDNLRLAAGTASEQLASSLPRPQELIDSALSLTQGDTSMLPLVHTNLLHHWQDTGQSPADAAAAANDDSSLMAKLTGEQVTPPEIEPPTGPWDDPEARIAYRTSQLMQPAILAHLQGIGADWNKEAADYAAELRKEPHPTSARAALDTSSLDRVLKIALGTGGAGAVIENVGPKLIGLLKGALDKAPPMKTFDPTAPDGAVKEGVPASEALLPPEPAALVQGDFKVRAAVRGEDGKIYTGQTHLDAVEAAGIDPESDASFNLQHGFVTKEGEFLSRQEAAKRLGKGSGETITSHFLPKENQLEPEPITIDEAATPAAKIARIISLEHENLRLQMEDTSGAAAGTSRFFQNKTQFETDNPNYYTDLVKKAETDGILAHDQATTDLATGHDIAGTLRNLLSDDSGMGPNPFAQFFRTPAQKNEAVYQKEGQNLAITNIIRFRGMADRQVAATMAKIEPLRKLLSPHMDEWNKALDAGPAGNPQNTMIGNLISYVEGRSYGAALSHDSPLAPVADIMRAAFQRSEANLRNAQSMGLIDLKSFYEDFFAHRWKDRAAVDREYYGPGRQGSGQSFNEREIPTVMDGIMKGLEPKIRDPLDLLMDYTNGVEHRLSALRVMDALNKAGHLEYKVTGSASPGYVPLVGLNSVRPAGQSGMLLSAYASPGAAKAYNYWLSKGLYTSATGSFYDKLLYASNSMIGLKLAFPGYHSLAIAGEAWISGFAHAFGELGAGEFARGLKDLGSTVTVIPKLADLMTKGYRAQRDYLNLVNNDTMDMLEASGMRPLGRQQIYRMGATPTLFQSISRKSLGYELKADVKAILGDPKDAAVWNYNPVVLGARVTGFVAKELGRVMNTVTAPLFDHIIPWMKTGAAVDEIQMMLRQNPKMAPGDRILAAQKIGANIDNRLGELNQDNLFWPKWSKQLLNLVTVSMGWEYGSMRFLGGASRDLALLRFNSPAARSGLGFMVATSLHNSMYQWIKDGRLPFSTPTPWTDLVAPRTGGMTPEGKPERAILPGYLKDVFGYARTVLNGINDRTNFMPSLFKLGTNKENPMFSVLSGWLTGEDKIGHHIANLPVNGIPPLGLDRHMYNYLKWTFGELATPIAIQTIHDRLRGTKLNEGEQLMGLRPSPTWVEDPERYNAGQASMNKRYDNEEIGRARRENSRLETPDASTGAVKTPRTMHSGGRGKRQMGQ